MMTHFSRSEDPYRIAAERIRTQISVRDALAAYGIEVNRQGFARCPLHEGDNTPSLKVYPDGKGWYCFGCHKGGDVLKFVMEYYNIGYKQALLRASADFSLPVFAAATAEENAAAQQRQAQIAERQARQREYTRRWEETIDLTRRIDILSDAVCTLLQKREEVDQWLEKHQAWDGK